MNSTQYLRRASAPLSLALLSTLVQAQTSPSQQATPPTQLQSVVVTGNPLRQIQADAAVQRLAGEELALRRTGTLGGTLDGLPGVSASAFGPQASRPILRGLDGDRLRILSNGGAAPDASSLSPDHAVSLDPLVVDAIEVVRGPAALLYGGNALGGVVNVLDNRVPKRGADGIEGALEARLGGAANERAASFLLDGGPRAGQHGLAWHVDGSKRQSDSQRSPDFSFDGRDYRRVRNSDGEQRSSAVGAGYVSNQGYAGVSLDDYHSEYGIPAEEGVRIRMQRQRLAQEGEWQWSSGWLRRLSWQASHTRYAHDEVEDTGEVGTRFRLTGNDVRLVMEHAPLGPLRGVVGVQAENQRFSALGEEAFVPNTRTRQQAAFLFEQWQAGDCLLSAGARVESVRQDSLGDAADSEEARFGSAQSRSFSPKSLSAQAAWQATPALRLQLSASQSQRAPTHYELYANGLHLATAAFERGDASLGLERARALEVAFIYSKPGTQAQLNLFQQRFSSFISLQGLAEAFEVDGERFPVYAFQAVPARLQGWELQLRQRLSSRLHGELQLDETRGSNRATGEPLPRLAPRRLRVALDWREGSWSLRLAASQVARQDRVSFDDQATPSYRWVDVAMSYRFKLLGQEALWTLKGQNLGNELAYNAGTIQTVRGLAPLPGRNLSSNLTVRF